MGVPVPVTGGPRFVAAIHPVMLIEMHCHTAEFSPCSEASAADLVREVYARGAQGIVLTDHHYLWTDSDLAALHRASGVPAAFLVLSGQEVSTIDLGDILVYGADKAFPFGLSVVELRAQAPDAALVWAHPYRWGRYPVVGNLLHPALDGIEIINGNQTDRENRQACQAWQQFGFNCLAGSDAHDLDAAARLLTRFHVPVRSLTDVVTAIRQRECRPRQRDLARAIASPATP